MEEAAVVMAGGSVNDGDGIVMAQKSRFKLDDAPVWWPQASRHARHVHSREG